MDAKKLWQSYYSTIFKIRKEHCSPNSLLAILKLHIENFVTHSGFLSMLPSPGK